MDIDLKEVVRLLKIVDSYEAKRRKLKESMRIVVFAIIFSTF